MKYMQVLADVQVYMLWLRAVSTYSMQVPQQRAASSIHVVHMHEAHVTIFAPRCEQSNTAVPVATITSSST
jgi:hypothetical protein